MAKYLPDGETRTERIAGSEPNASGGGAATATLTQTTLDTTNAANINFLSKITPIKV
jgi:hypothetical protein